VTRKLSLSLCVFIKKKNIIKKIRKEYGGEIPQAQNGMNPERAYRQPDWNEEEPLELVNNFNQEVIDSGQTFILY
jgi:hypothetical protein